MDDHYAYVVSCYYPTSKSTFYFYCKSEKEADILADKMEADGKTNICVDIINTMVDYGTGLEC
jgi:hypothetical protein